MDGTGNQSKSDSKRWISNVFSHMQNLNLKKWKRMTQV
jgi:hypothetical protein